MFSCCLQSRKLVTIQYIANLSSSRTILIKLLPDSYSTRSSFYQQSFEVFFFNRFLLQPDGTDLFHFVHGHQTWTEYLVHMEQDGAWGDHVILCAAANYFETCIRVVSSLSHSNDVIITPHCPVDESKPLVLGHIHEVHYVSLQPMLGTAHYIMPIKCNFCFIVIIVS